MTASSASDLASNPTATLRSRLLMALALGVLVWISLGRWAVLREGSWEALLPLLAGPVFAWLLGQPWTRRPVSATSAEVDESAESRIGWIGLGAVLLLLGWAGQIGLMLTLGWVFITFGLLANELTPEKRSSFTVALAVAAMGFPWLAVDGQTLGWQFRITGAAVAEPLLLSTGLTVARTGTMLWVAGQPVDVSAACSGLSSLPLIMMAGAVVTWFRVGSGPAFWLLLPAWLLVGWLANLVRILVIALSAALVSPDFAAGWFHDVGGVLALAGVFLLAERLLALAAWTMGWTPTSDPVSNPASNPTVRGSSDEASSEQPTVAESSS